MYPETLDSRHRAIGDRVISNFTIGSVVKYAEKALKTRVYSHKYYIISFLYDNPGATSDAIRENCPSSNSTFFRCLSELRSAGIIIPMQSSDDLRTRHYHLSLDIKSLISKTNRSIGEFLSGKLTLKRSDRPGIIDLVKSIESQIGAQYYSREYRIIIFLYENETSNPSEMCKNISTSEASFYYSLKRLVESGVICSQSSQSDKRQRNYRLSDESACLLDSAHRTLLLSHLL